MLRRALFALALFGLPAAAQAQAPAPATPPAPAQQRPPASQRPDAAERRQRLEETLGRNFDSLPRGARARAVRSFRATQPDMTETAIGERWNAMTRAERAEVLRRAPAAPAAPERGARPAPRPPG